MAFGAAKGPNGLSDLHDEFFLELCGDLACILVLHRDENIDGLAGSVANDSIKSIESIESTLSHRFNRFDSASRYVINRFD